MIADRVALSDGASIPQLGFGVYKVPVEDAAGAVSTALQAGYRHVDTAALYGNEREVGRAVRASEISRQEIFVTTKLWNDRHADAERAFDESLERLGLDYIDLYLIHWPVPSAGQFVAAWRALQRIASSGRARSIGVSNFQTAHLRRLIEETGVTPVINQVELHPWLPQRELRTFHDAHGIRTEAWSPLGRGRVLAEPVLARIAHKHGVSAAQVVIRWHLDAGTIVIPKSVHPERIRQNAQVFGFALDEDDRAAIAALETGVRTGSDPDSM